jgi:hypothetical protein
VANQWNIFKVDKSVFTEVGTGDWSAVTGVSFVIDGSPTSEVICYIDSIELIQTQSFSSPLPLNGGGFRYTNVGGNYREIVPDLEIRDDDYLENVTIIGQKQDGCKIKIIARDCLNDGAIALALQEKSEIVNSTQFTSHYKKISPIKTPISIYEYLAA